MLTRRAVLQGASSIAVALTTWPASAASASATMAAPSEPSSDLLVHSKLPFERRDADRQARSAFVTPQAEFYIRDHGTVPKIEERATRWRSAAR